MHQVVHPSNPFVSSLETGVLGWDNVKSFAKVEGDDISCSFLTGQY